MAVATTFVDNSGITRVKTVPLDRLAHLAAWGVGASTRFDCFRFDDWLAAPPDGRAPVGDLRIIPDLARVVPLAAQPGWAWAPGDRYRQDGTAAPALQPLVAARARATAWPPQGLQVQGRLRDRVGDLDGAARSSRPAATGPGLRDDPADPSVATMLATARGAGRAGRRRGAVPPGVRDRSTRGVGGGRRRRSRRRTPPCSSGARSAQSAQRHGFRTSFSPKVEVEGVGNGGHVHLSLWRDGDNLMAGGDGPLGLTADRCGVRRRHPRPAACAAGDRGALRWRRICV